jgi:HEAT repeat protein
VFYQLDDDDSEENYVVGEHAMDRLARYLGGKAVLPVSFQFIPQMLASEQWQQRHAALMAISAIGEGCVKIMEPELGNIIQMIVPYFNNPSARVRYATCNAIGQMSTDFAPALQKNFHEIVLSSLIPVMEDPEPRVQAHAAAALVNFCEEVDKSVLDPYLDPLFERLLVLLNTSKTYVQEQAITTIATVADSAEDKFIKYHGAIMPLLLNILRQATAKQYRLLRGKAMECASLIALAVGKEVFAPFTQDFISLLIEGQQSVTESDDPQTSYLLASWARMCKVLGPDFLPYLPVIMPPLLQSAQLKPDFAVLDPDEDAETNYSAEDGWEFVGVDGQQVGIKTTVLEEKCTAVEMLICYARELGAGFLPYITQVLDIVLPLLKFYFHDGVRHAAACVVPLLLQDAKKANVNAADISAMWHTIYAKLVDVIMNEMDPSFLLQVYIAFYESLEIVGENSMTPEELEKFIQATEAQLKEFYERLETRQNNRRAADFDAEEEEAMLEEEEAEESVMSELARAIHTVFLTHRLAFLPYFDKILPSVVHFLQHENPSARQWALCVFDDLVEFTGPQSFAYSSHFLERMVNSIQDPNNDVRQAAAYGLGACGQFGGPQYADACSAALNPLFAIINDPKARDVDNVYVTENAISAVSKICRYNSSKFEVDPVISAWVAALPIVNDEEEAPTTYTYLMDLVDAGHPAIVSANNLPHIVKIYVEVLSADVIKGELADRMANGLKAIVSGLDDSTRNQLWASIEPEKASKLQQRLA